jgi:hypothetical protein
VNIVSCETLEMIIMVDIEAEKKMIKRLMADAFKAEAAGDMIFK